MDLSKTLNIAGLVLSLIGTIIVFYCSPKSSSLIYTDEETIRRAKKDKLKNKVSRFGLLLIVIGVAFQFVTVIELI